MLFSKGKERAVSDMPREVIVPMPQPPDEPAPVPAAYRRPQPQQDEPQREVTREIMVRAAEAYDATQRHIEDLKSKLNEAMLGLRDKNQTIERLELQLLEERGRVQDYRTERDDAVQDRSDLLACFEGLTERVASIGRTLDKFDFPSRKRTRRAKSAPTTVGEQLGGAPGDTASDITVPTNGGSDGEPLQSEV